MPSQKARLALTLPSHLEKALTEFAEAIDKPVSTATVSILVEMIPQLEGLAKIARASKSGNKAAAKRAAVHMFGDAMAEVMAMQQPDMFSKKKGRG